MYCLKMVFCCWVIEYIWFKEILCFIVVKLLCVKYKLGIGLIMNG